MVSILSRRLRAVFDLLRLGTTIIGGSETIVEIDETVITRPKYHIGRTKRYQEPKTMKTSSMKSAGTAFMLGDGCIQSERQKK
ncbi:hypothetical protein QR680_018282 [Steinernema hermaphroditum]|uniref:Uncharacterized protein n=1 Tax=Steinernema hermaphroditum TaxID=289476 RepID=A0AA39HIA6_9BILA|nr:hypothetical protein QR680_018282 [Steinernema hermaphroditum]